MCGGWCVRLLLVLMLVVWCSGQVQRQVQRGVTTPSSRQTRRSLVLTTQMKRQVTTPPTPLTTTRQKNQQVSRAAQTRPTQRSVALTTQIKRQMTTLPTPLTTTQQKKPVTRTLPTKHPKNQTQRPMIITPEKYTWKEQLQFFQAYNEQWPIRKAILISSIPAFARGVNHSSVRLVTSRTIQQLNVMERVLVREMSRLGISSSVLRLSERRRGSEDVERVLRLRETSPQPRRTVLLLGLDPNYIAFIRQVAREDGLSAPGLAWLVAGANLSTAALHLTLELGLRPDMDLLVAELLPSGGGARLARWTGSSLVTLPVTWRGTPAPLPTQAAPGVHNLDLREQTIGVAVYHDPPYVILSGGNVSGWFVDVWRELEEVLGFRTRFYQPRRGAGGLFRYAAEELSRGRADLVLAPFSMRSLEDGDFSLPVTTMRFRFYVQRATVSSSWAQFARPFSGRLWGSVCGMVALAAAIMAASYLLARHLGLETQQAPIYNVAESSLVIFGSLLQQGPDFSPDSLGGRIVLWSAYAFGLVIYTAYSAALISKLTVRTLEPPFSSLEELLGSSFVPHVLQDSGPHRLAMSAESGAWRDLREHTPRLVVTQSVAQSVQTVAQGSRVALLALRDRVNPVVQAPPLDCRLAQIPVDILNLPGSLLMQRNSLFKKAIDQQLLVMASSGRLVRWRDRSLQLTQDDPCPADGSLAQFNLEQVALPFLILGGGVLVSLLMLGLEFALRQLLPPPPSPSSQARRPNKIHHTGDSNRAFLP